MGKERPDLEETKNKLVVSMAKDAKQLLELEDRTLHLLSTSEGNVLDNEPLINTLNNSKLTSGVIKQRVAEAEKTEIEINLAREEYRPVATRGSLIYFVIADLGRLDPMYQYSLSYFNKVRACRCPGQQAASAPVSPNAHQTLTSLPACDAALQLLHRRL